MSVILKFCELLSEKHMMSILMFLRTFGASSKSEIYKAVSTNPRMSKKIETLENAGLVSSRRDAHSRNKVIIDLTPAGISCADTLLELERLPEMYPQTTAYMDSDISDDGDFSGYEVHDGEWVSETLR